MKPTQILSKICKLYGLTGPTYTKVSVTVDDKIFTIPKPISADKIVVTDMENLALSCLHQLKDLPKIGHNFVPEHVEMRTLFLPEKPGMEQVQFFFQILQNLLQCESIFLGKARTLD